MPSIRRCAASSAALPQTRKAQLAEPRRKLRCRSQERGSTSVIPGAEEAGIYQSLTGRRRYPAGGRDGFAARLDDKTDQSQRYALLLLRVPADSGITQNSSPAGSRITCQE